LNSTYTVSDHPRVGLITNPYSRRNRAGLAALEAMIAGHRNIIHRVTHCADDVPGVLQDFAEQGIGVVAVNGGDGTTAQVFSGLFEASPFENRPAIVLLPGGTTNMNAADTGMRGNLKQSVAKLCRWSDGEALAVERVSRPILRVEGAVGQRALYGMFFGAGTIIRGIEYCHNRVHRVGLVDEIGPGVALLRALWGILRGDPRFAAPVTAGIRLEEQRQPRETRLVILLITSLERLFLGMRPWWGPEQRPLHCTWVQQSAKHLLRQIPGLLRGKPRTGTTPQNGYFSHNTAQIELSMDTNFTIDGELYQASRAHGPIRIDAAGELEFLKIGP